ncbi:hypothetical protein D9M68_858070 [compost metagenome]
MATILRISLENFSTTGAGVFAGRKTAPQPGRLISGKPASAKVGTSGNCFSRRALATEMSLTLPPLSWRA